MHAIVSYNARKAAVWVVWTVCVASGVNIGRAQDPPSLEKSSSQTKSKWLINDEVNVRFQLSLGRIALQPGRFKLEQRHEGDGTLNSPQQSMCIQLNEGMPSVEFSFRNPEEEFLLTCHGSGEAKIEHAMLVDGVPVTCKMVQPQQGLMEVSVHPVGAFQLSSADAGQRPPDRGSPFRSLKIDSLWHLWILEPDWAQRHFAPMLSRLNPRWSIANDCSRIENRLVEAIRLDSGIDNQGLDDLVKQLGGSDSWSRVYAERQLTGMGLAVLPRLANINSTSIDAETRFRLDRVQRGLVPSGEDSATRVATWLSGDAALCKSIAERTSWDSNREVLLKHVEFLAARQR